MARGRCHSQFHGAGAWPSLSSGRCVTTRSKRPRLEALGSDLHCFELQPHQRTETTPTHGTAVVLKGRQRSAKAPTSDKNSPGPERALHDQLPWEQTVAPTKQCRSKQNYPRPGWREIASCKERRALVWLHVWIQVGCWRLPIVKWFQWRKQKCYMSWELKNNAWVVPNRLASFFLVDKLMRIAHLRSGTISQAALNLEKQSRLSQNSHKPARLRRKTKQKYTDKPKKQAAGL